MHRSLLTLSLLLAAVAVHAAAPPRVKSTPVPLPTPARFLALGDSYTIGESVAADQRWPEQLVRALAAHHVGVAAPQLIARTGWTTTELSHAIDAAQPRGPYALVTLLIGVNDQFRGGSVADYRPRFAALLQRAIQFAGGDATHVIVVSIPDWGATPFAAAYDRRKVAAAIDAFNAANREESSRAGTKYVDVTAISRRVATGPELAAADGLHPSPRMYAAWVEAIEPVARELLSAPPRH